MYENAVYRNNLNIAQDEGLAFWQTPANAVVLYDAVPADCLGKVVHIKTEEIQHQKIHWSPRLSRTNYPQTCLQDRHDGHAQPKLVQGNDELTIEPNLDFRVSGMLRAEVEQEEEKSRKQFARLVHAVSITQTKMH